MGYFFKSIFACGKEDYLRWVVNPRMEQTSRDRFRRGLDNHEH